MSERLLQDQESAAGGNIEAELNAEVYRVAYEAYVRFMKNGPPREHKVTQEIDGKVIELVMLIP